MDIAIWSPATTAPIHMGLVDLPVPLAISCGPNIGATASGPAGAVVTYAYSLSAPQVTAMLNGRWT